MVKTLIFDTETTGKADFKADTAAKHQPWLVQLAAILYNGRDLAASVNVLCVPQTVDGEVVLIPAEASQIHGVTQEMAEQAGLPYKVVLPLFNNMLRVTDRLVAHNMDFDIRIMSGMFKRFAFPANELERPKRICTMKSTENVLKLPNLNWPGKFKWPTLDEAYRHLVDPEGFEGAHDALADAKACAAVLWKAEDAGHIR